MTAIGISKPGGPEVLLPEIRPVPSPGTNEILIKVAVAGESLTHDIAVLFSTNGLKNIMNGQGRVGQGPVRTTCKTGSSTTTCHSSQMACKVTTPKTCLGAWLCLPL